MIIHNLDDPLNYPYSESPDDSDDFPLENSDSSPPSAKAQKLDIIPNSPLTKNHKCDTLDTNASSAAHSFLITDIKPSLHDDNRVNIFINGAYDFSLEIPQVIDLKVKIGKSFTKKELDSLRNESEFGKLYTTTLEWVLTRPHSQKEIRDHLKTRQIKRKMENKRRESDQKYKSEHRSDNPYKNPDNLDKNGRLKFQNSPWARATKILPDITDENIEKVLTRLSEKGFIDDYKFAKFYVENRFVKKGISPTRLRQELSKKGVEKSIIDEVLRDSDRDDLSEINKIIDKKSKKYNKSQLKNYLIRQGFPYSRVDEALNLRDDL